MTKELTERRASISKNTIESMQELAEQQQRSLSTCPEASAKEVELMAQTKEAKPQAPIFEYQEKPIYELVTGTVHVIAAFLGLMLVAPLMLVIAIAVKLSDLHAPVLYRGRRIGKLGKPYTILKFRTMAPGAEQRIGARLIGKNSPQVTALGRLLRKHKLDELPQLVNVLRGEMRLVGPRPTREVFLEELRARIPGYDRRFLVEPGITGLAQVRGGYYTDPKNKLRYESLYMRRQSLWLDLKLVTATLLMLVFRTSAFRLVFFATLTNGRKWHRIRQLAGWVGN